MLQPSWLLLDSRIEEAPLDSSPRRGPADRLLPDRLGLLTDTTSTASRRTRGSRLASIRERVRTDETPAKIKGLDGIAAERGQTLAQMALAWVLRDDRMTSTVFGASSVAQLEANVAALEKLEFSEEELAEIDRFATESDVNFWAASSSV